MTRITFLPRFRWIFTVLPLLGIGLTAWIQSHSTPPAGLDRGLLYVEFVAIVLGAGVALLAWSRHYRANGNVEYGGAMIRGMYTVLLAFVGWSLVLTSTAIWEPSLVELEALIVVTSVSLTALLLLVSSSSMSFPNALTDRPFGLVLLLLATIGYVVQVTLTSGWNVVMIVALIPLISLVWLR